MQPFERTQKTLHKQPLEIKKLLSAAIWEELRVFLAVAKTRSFAAAATILGSSQPKVSRQIKRLQDVVQAQLIITRSSGIQLTDSGKWLANQLLPLDEKIFDLANALQGERSNEVGLVRISATEAITAIFITPSLVELRRLYPGIQLHLKNPINFSEVRSNQTDMMLSFVEENAADTVSIPLGHVNLVTAASRSYVAERGLPTAQNLAQHEFVDTVYYSGKAPIWRPWQQAVEQGRIAHWADNAFAYALTVKSGLGVGLLGNYALANSDLMRIDIGVQVRLPIFLVALKDRLASAPVQLVFRWLEQVFIRQAQWFGDDSQVTPNAARDLSDTIALLIEGHRQL